MDTVASELGISKKTLYQYFSDKQDLVSQVIDFILEETAFSEQNKDDYNAIDEVLSIRQRVTKTLKIYNNNLEPELKKMYPNLYQKVYETKRKRLYDSTVKNLKKGIAQGFYRKTINIDVVTQLQVGRILYTLNTDYGLFETFEVNAIDVFDSILDYHMHAICTSEGLQYFKEQLNNIQHES